MSPRLSPFAMWWALPTSDYYGDSVTLGLAPFRPSHVPLVLNVSSVTEAPHSSPSMKSFFIAPPVGGGRSRKLNDPPLVALRYRRCSSECEVAPLGIGIQAIQLFALSRGSCGTAPSASSSGSRFSGMLLSPPAFAFR